jgi:hypothetical protein
MAIKRPKKAGGRSAAYMGEGLILISVYHVYHTFN